MEDPYNNSQAPIILLQLLQQQRELVLNEMLHFIDETSSDPDPEARIRRQKRFLKTSTFWEEDCKHMPEDQFVQLYRVTKEVFGEILDIIYPSLLTSSVVGDSIHPSKKLALALRYLSSGADFATLAHLFGVGLSTVRTIIRDVTDAIATNPFFLSLVSFPSSEDEFYTISKDFFDFFQFPNCIGAVDDTHITIQKPREDPTSYFDYKKNYSVHLQAVCDARTRVLFYHIRAPGRNNDGGVAEMSGFNGILRSGLIPEKYHLVGDPAFALHKNLLNRYPGLHLQPTESHYNWRQSRCRMVIESLFGRMKGRWRVLVTTLPFRDLHTINRIITVCVLLHNFLLTKVDTILHPRHHFQDAEYRSLMLDLELQQEKALEDLNKNRKRKRAELTPKEKRNVVAKVLKSSLSEENCVIALGM